MHSAGTRYWGLAWPALEWLERNVQPGWRTLETGGGASTIVFASAGAEHTAISPDSSEHDGIRRYCEEIGVDLGKVTFVPESSHVALPALADDGPLDVVLLDGAHGFPYPVLDWYYAGQRLRVGGHLLVDDAYLGAVHVLVEFLRESPSWELVEVLGMRTPCFRRLDDADPGFDAGLVEGRVSFDYLRLPKRLEAWARYRLIDQGPLQPLVQRATLRRGGKRD